MDAATEPTKRPRKARTPSSPAIQPIAVTIPDAEIISGLSRPTLYRRNKEGALPFRKVKGRTLVMVDDLKRLIMGEAA